MSVVAKELWIKVKELFLEQYRGNLRPEIESQTYFDNEDETTKNYVLPEGADNRLQAVLKLSIDKLFQPLDDASISLQNALDMDGATGKWLDLIGSIAGVKRKYEESDTSYRDRIKNEVVLNKGIPDAVIYSSALISGDPHPQYMDEAPATFFVYDGPRPDGEGGWEQGGHQLSRAQVRKLAPAGVLGLPGAAINAGDDLTEGNEEYLVDEDGKLILMEADDSTIERDVLLADNIGNIVVTPQSVPVRVKLTGPSVPSIPVIETEWNGATVDAVRIKDLPDAGDWNSYFVRDSDVEGTVKTDAINDAKFDELWESTPAED